MNLMDLVMLINHKTKMPVIGQVIGFTKKRIRVAVRNGEGYISVLRSKHNLTMAKKSRRLV